MSKATSHRLSQDLRVTKSNPFTPVRRLFESDRLKPTHHHRVRHQKPSHGNSEREPVLDTPTEEPAARNSFPHRHARACMALQNEDLAEGVVVITALSTLPFCCHEDLLTMSRAALVGVAESLNTKLPVALRISVSRTRTDVAIRNEIEFIVGLRTEVQVPPTQQRQKGYLQVDVKEKLDKTPPTSPSRIQAKRKFQFYGTPGTPRLERLAEEEEEEDRPMKHQTMRPIIKETDDDMDEDVSATPTPVPSRALAPVLRSRSAYISSSPTPKSRPGVQRAHSMKLQSVTTNIKVNAVMNSKPSRHRKQTNIEGGRKRRASLPAIIRRTSPKQKARGESTTTPFLALPEEGSSLTSHSSEELSPASYDSHRVGMKRKRILRRRIDDRNAYAEMETMD